MSNLKDKNILYVLRTVGYGGTEKVVFNLCRYLKNDFNNIVIASEGGTFEGLLQEMGIKHYKLPPFENKDPYTIIKSLKILYEIVRKEKINLIHSHHRYSTMLSNIVSKVLNIKLIHTAHNTFYNKKKVSFLGKNIIAVGEMVKNNLIDFFGIHKENITVILNGLEDEQNETSGIEEILHWKNEGYFIVGNIGRICEQKGMEYFIESMNYIKKRHNNIKFLIVGDGEDREKLEKLVDTHKLNYDIIFLGFRNDIPNVISNLDLVVLSSLWEGLPLTPIEVFSKNKTIIATNVDGTPEIVIDKYNGLLVNARQPKEIAEAIIKIYENDEFKKYLEVNARKTFEESFKINVMINKYREYYKNLLSRGVYK